jgi:hypothetical protein
MGARLSAGIFSLLLIPSLAEAETYTNIECGFSIELPSGWEIARAPWAGDRECAFKISPKDLKKRLADYNVDVHSMNLRIVEDVPSFEKGAEGAGFEKEDGKWYVLGRMGAREDAKPIQSKRWTGLYGVALVGCYYQEGGPEQGYAGLCDMPAAFLYRGTRGAGLQCGPQTEKEFDRVLRSFRFLR